MQYPDETLLQNTSISCQADTASYDDAKTPRHVKSTSALNRSLTSPLSRALLWKETLSSSEVDSQNAFINVDISLKLLRLKVSLFGTTCNITQVQLTHDTACHTRDIRKKRSCLSQRLCGASKLHRGSRRDWLRTFPLILHNSHEKFNHFLHS